LATLVRPAEFALIKGVTRQTVATAMKGRIAAAVVEREGLRLIDRDMALELWDRNTVRNNNAKVGAAGAAGLAPAAPATAPTPAQLREYIEALPEDSIPDLNESRARREHYQAEKAKLEALQGRGELVPVADVKSQAFALARGLRDGLMALPDRLAPMLAATQDAAQVHRLLSEEIRVALRVLADG
jgi:hypothetical protein